MRPPIDRPRLDSPSVSPVAIKAMLALEQAVNRLPLEPSLVALVKVRASQLNGCAWSVDRYTHEASLQGESERKLYAVALWRESPLFSERERAALAWTESVTGIARSHAPDADYAWLSTQFIESERVDLTLLISTVNSWNRLRISFGQGLE
ncbi:carboxymuconolactone decarboxylase family protein [Pseudomonas abietaniphila]|uniref:Alkylhydroperoxidase AhpD family core domain-containing protein n=1 Tax=Pseudomonas abietaniphila TaxID=89065 RepID=A0A1G8M962_9PSED|nr:carboxymuconolactone decarboxylase family protein [Pseudomonas abietaniphila]SDI64393.1 alkylhydroperoxidase AhpD family core domain-containing protein [Pseudomonas abietaniphila]